MKKLRTIITSLAMSVGIMTFVFAPSAQAADFLQNSACQGQSPGAQSICSENGKANSANLAKNVINMIALFIGLVSVMAIVLGGMRYVTSNGDAGRVKTAKDTILYAVIGLVVALSAFAIVNFVVSAAK